MNFHLNPRIKKKKEKEKSLPPLNGLMYKPGHSVHSQNSVHHHQEIQIHHQSHPRNCFHPHCQHQLHHLLQARGSGNQYDADPSPI